MLKVQVVYDGECPFCSRYAQLVTIRKSVGELELIDAREDGPTVREVKKRDLDLDEGMVVIVDGRYFHGSDAMHCIALLSTRVGLFNRLNAALFKHSRLAGFFYPVLRTGRNAVLALLGRRKLSQRPSSP